MHASRIYGSQLDALPCTQHGAYIAVVYMLQVPGLDAYFCLI